MMRTARCMAFTGAGRGDRRESWVAQLYFGLQALQAALAGLYDLAIGGTAAGKGLNAHSRFADLTAHYIAGLTGSPFRSAPNKFFALFAHDALMQVSAALRTLSGGLMKLANDVRCRPAALLRHRRVDHF